MKRIEGTITATFPLKNSIEVRTDAGEVFYFKSATKLASVRKFQVGQRFTYEGFVSKGRAE